MEIWSVYIYVSVTHYFACHKYCRESRFLFCSLTSAQCMILPILPSKNICILFKMRMTYMITYAGILKRSFIEYDIKRKIVGIKHCAPLHNIYYSSSTLNLLILQTRVLVRLWTSNNTDIIINQGVDSGQNWFSWIVIEEFFFIYIH